MFRFKNLSMSIERYIKLFHVFRAATAKRPSNLCFSVKHLRETGSLIVGLLLVVGFHLIKEGQKGKESAVNHVHFPSHLKFRCGVPNLQCKH